MEGFTSKKSYPDTVIKLFENDYSSKNNSDQLKELLQFITKSKNLGIVFKLRECLRGDIYELTYNYIIIRKIEESEKIHANFQDDGDPTSDYFSTLWRIKSVIPVELESNESKDTFGLHCVESNPSSIYVILAFKVLDDDRTAKLDRTWKDWTGTKELLTVLSADYNITLVSCLKGVNVIPDVFKYFVLIEMNKIKRRNKEDEDIYLKNCIQNFRINRMFGYCAIYTKCDMTNLITDLDSISRQ